MAKEFTLEGEVGWDINAWTVKNILSKADGEDVKINFSSPGGSVFEGFTMFNLFKNYSGAVDFHLIGEASSMGSYIPLSGRNITAEPNATYFIHNAGSFVGGDQNRLRKVANILEGLSNIIAKEYSNKTGMEISALKKMMDEETWFFGAEMVEVGFVDSIIGEPDSDPQAKQNTLALAKESFAACLRKLKQEKPDGDYQQAAAFIGKKPENNILEIDNNIKPPKAAKKGAFMNLEELKAKHPALYQAVLALGIEEGIKEERDSVSAHLIMAEATGAIKTATDAIKAGERMTAAHQATYFAAGMNKKDIQARTDDDNDGADNVDETTDEEATGKKVLDLVKAKTGFEEAK